MATSSSGGSLESIRSSTSEGNRSTTSSDSRRSSSLSTHSSDSAGSGGGAGGRMTDPHHLHHFYHHHQCGGGAGATGGRGSGSGSRFFAHQATKLHILSPISDKSQEPASETSDNNRNNNSLRGSPEDAEQLTSPTGVGLGGEDAPLSLALPLASAPPPVTANGKGKRRTPQNKNLINLALQQQSSGEAEIQGSDSGISIESRGGGGGGGGGGLRSCKSFSGGEGSGGGSAGGGGSEGAGGASTDPSEGVTSAPPPAAPADFADLPFDMPKLRRRQRLMPQDTCTSGSATSVDLYDLPFDMPKLRRRLRAATSVPAPAAAMVGIAVQTGPVDCAPATSGGALAFLAAAQPPPLGGSATDSSGVSHASSSQSVRDGDRPAAPPALNLGRASLTLNLGLGKNIGGNLGLDDSGDQQNRIGLCLNLASSNFMSSAEIVDVSVPLERQEWYHGAITRLEAENILRLLREGSYLVRNSESTRQDYSLSLKSARGFMHMRIQQNKETGKFILGQFSKPFESIPEMIHHYTINRLPIRGAEHMCLLHPVMEQLL